MPAYRLASFIPMALFAVATGGPLPASAQVVITPLDDCTTVRTVNSTQSRVWVTIYDLARLRHLDYGWVDACTYRDWKSGSYACGSYYYVRGEVKNPDLSANVYDTTVQINPKIRDLNSNAVILHRGTGNYYWEHSVGLYDAVTGKPNGCDGVAPTGAPPIDFSFTNAGQRAVRLLVTSVTTKAALVNNECFLPGQGKSWKLAREASYAVNASDMNDRACTQASNDGVAQVVQPVNGAIRLNYLQRYVLEQH